MWIGNHLLGKINSTQNYHKKKVLPQWCDRPVSGHPLYHTCPDCQCPTISSKPILKTNLIYTFSFFELVAIFS